MNGWVAPVFVLAGVIVSSVVTYLVARRNTSGSVDTSDAATLWSESNTMRKELRDEVVTLRQELTSVKKELILAEKENTISHKKIIKLIARVKELEKQVRKLGGKV